MKRFSKIILSVAAASAMATAMAVSASAMTATYADGTVTLADVNDTGSSQTLLVLDGVNLTSIAETNIKQIDQKDNDGSFTSVPVGTLANGTYEVRIGGSDGTLQTATFTVGGTTVETESIVIGDTNGDGIINTTDVGHVGRKAVSQTGRIGNAGTTRTRADGNGDVVIGDTNGDGVINTTDVGHVGRKAVSQTGRIGNAGTTVEVVK